MLAVLEIFQISIIVWNLYKIYISLISELNQSFVRIQYRDISQLKNIFLIKISLAQFSNQIQRS